MHNLPSASDFSYKDDTTHDSLEDLIASKVQQLATRGHEASPAEASRSLDFSCSPIRSEKGRERMTAWDPDFDDHYDDLLHLLPAFNPPKQDSDSGLTRSFSFTQRIISCNLKHHQPDDFDVESLTISVKRRVRTVVSRDEGQLCLRTLPLYLTNVNLSRNTLL